MTTPTSATAPGLARWRTPLVFACLAVTAMVLGLGAPDASAQDSGVAVESITTSCVRGGGRLDIVLTNTSGATLSPTVMVDGVERTVDVVPGTATTVTITGRANGMRSVLIDGVDSGEVDISCSSRNGPASNDDLRNAGRLQWRVGDGVARASLSQNRFSSRSVEPGERLDCVVGGGSTWFQLPATSNMVTISPRLSNSVGIYRSTTTNPDYDDLTFEACVESPSIEIATTPGEVLMLQLSGTDADAFIVGDLTTEPTLPSGISVDGVSSRCIPSGGVISIVLQNSGNADSVVYVQPVGIRSRAARQLAIGAGETVTTEFSSRRDGVYEIWVNGLITTERGAVDCASTGTNNEVSTAQELTFVDGTTRAVRDGTYGISDEEVDVFDSEESSCGNPFYEGSAWYTFVATDEAFWVDGNDDMDIVLWTSDVSQPATAKDLEQIACRDAEHFQPVPVTPGERYWVSSVGDRSGPQFFTGAAARNDSLADAPFLSDLTVVPAAGASLEAGEERPCFSREGSLWWRWIADRSDIVGDPLSLVGWGIPTPPMPAAQDSHVTYSVWSAEIADPTISDLSLVSCATERDAVETSLDIGRTYWIRVNVDKLAYLAIAPQLDVVVSTSVQCNERGGAFVSWTISNGHAVPLNLSLVLAGGGQLSTKTATIGPDSTQTVRMSGRLDGRYTSNIYGAPVAGVGNTSVVDVQCAERSELVEVESSCLAGRGRIDIYVTQSFVLRVESGPALIQRFASSQDGQVARTTITGRRNGVYTVVATPSSGDRAGVIVKEVTIDCS